MGIAGALLAFRRGPYFRVFYLVVLALMVSSILVIPLLACLLIPVAMIALPWWLKDRSVKILAINGVVVLVLSSIFFSAITAQNLGSQDPGALSADVLDLVLTNGTVTPGRGAANAIYAFAVNFTTTSESGPSDFQVWLNLSKAEGIAFSDLSRQMDASDSTDMNLADGKAYEAVLTVEDGVYFFWFSVHARNETSQTWLSTPAQLGPVVASFGTLFAFTFLFALQFLIVPILFYYVLVFFVWFSKRTRALRGRRIEAEGESGFMCTNCGSDVPADAATCPKCGAVFEEAGKVPKGEEPDETP